MARQKKAPAGAPLWMVTFADMMSILVCFFVLIISFSTMDQKRFYEMVGSVQDAFGVDRVTMLKDIIELDGVPFLKQTRRLIPVPMAVLAVSQIQRESNPDCEPPESALENEPETPFGHEKTRWDFADKALEPGRQKQEEEAADQQKRQGMEGEQAPQDEQGERTGEYMAYIDEETDQQGRWRDQNQETGQGPASEPTEGVGRTDRQDPRIDEVERLLNAVLSPNLDGEVVSVEAREGEIKITFPASATFGSGSDGLSPSVLPVIDEVGRILSQTQGPIAVIGHTDNIPISTARFPSNWELSSARATSVLRRLELTPGMESRRLLVMGYGDTQPLEPNDTPDNRAKNRRVEIILRQP